MAYNDGVGTILPMDTCDLLTYFFDENPDADTLISMLNQTFSDAALTGGYSPVSVKPCQTAVHYAVEIIDRKSGHVSFSMQATAMDVNAFQILRNMACRLSFEGLLVSLIEVRRTDQKEISMIEFPIPDEYNENEVYSKKSQMTNFSVSWENSNFNKSRRVQVKKSIRGNGSPLPQIRSLCFPDMSNLGMSCWEQVDLPHLLDIRAIPIQLPESLPSLMNIAVKFSSIESEKLVRCSS